MILNFRKYSLTMTNKLPEQFSSKRSVSSGFLFLFIAKLMLFLPVVYGDPSTNFPLGINTESVKPWAPQIFFVDTFKRSLPWISNNFPYDYTWNSGVPIPMDSEGYPLEIPYTPPGGGPDQIVSTVIFDGLQGKYPSGNYTLIFEGTGIVQLFGASGFQQFTNAGTYTVNVDSYSNPYLFLQIAQSQVSDHVRNIRLILPGYENVYETEPLYPPTMDLLRPFSTIRFMQTQVTNGGEYPCDNSVSATSEDCVKAWENRTTTTNQTQAGSRGVALEYLIDIANTTDNDIWLCIPHGASDDYVRQFAGLVRDRLEPGLKAYIELSNELWNYSGPYPQSLWARNSGLVLGLDTDPETARKKFVAKRVAEVLKIFEDEFINQTHRLVKVMPGFSGIPSSNQDLLGYLNDETLNPHGIEVDALAVAAYIGYPVAGETLHQGLENTITVDQILDLAEDEISIDRPSILYPGEMIFSVKTLVSQIRQITDNHGITLIAYEGGQHLVELNGWGNNIDFGNKLVDANRHNRFYDIITDLLNVWYQEAGQEGSFMHYTFLYKATPEWGSWGALEYTEQPLSEAHKYRALTDYIQNHQP